MGVKESGDMADYMITGRLVGSIIPAERITASNVFIPLDVAGRSFDAGVNAHGSAHGGQPMGILSADLTLTKQR